MSNSFSKESSRLFTKKIFIFSSLSLLLRWTTLSYITTRSLGDLNYVFAGLLTLHNILSYLFTDFIFRDVEVLFRALFDYSVHKHVGVPGGSLAHAASSWVKLASACGLVGRWRRTIHFNDINQVDRMDGWIIKIVPFLCLKVLNVSVIMAAESPAHVNHHCV